jgi:hypothetical protein
MYVCFELVSIDFKKDKTSQKYLERLVHFVKKIGAGFSAPKGMIHQS